MKAFCPETLDQLADRWTVLMNQLNRHSGPYPDRFFVEIAEFVQQTRHIINPDPFEHEVLQTASWLLEAGNLKMALFRLHEVIEARIEGRLF